jgi:alkaline phosphatase D
VEVDGLDPGRHHWYRFRDGGHLSRIGRTRTCPDPRRPLVRLDLAFVSCQNFEKGYYTAYRHLAEDDLDVVLHLGDYIYENPPRRNLPRRHVGGEPAAFLRRRAAAYRAYWEHMPLRRPPRGPTMPLFRRLRLGDLVELNLLDTRQYRNDQPCDEDAGGGRVVTCPERVDPRRTILGSHQRRWLLDGLDRAQARWNVLAQQVVMAELDLHPGAGRAWWSDAWDGYAADRDRILRFLWARQPANPVVLTGDIHAFLVNDLQLPGRGPDRPVVATELVGTSISSGASKSSGFRRHLADNPTSASSRAACAATPAARCCASAGTPTSGSWTRSSARERRSAPWPATFVETGRPGAEQG